MTYLKDVKEKLKMNDIELVKKNIEKALALNNPILVKYMQDGLIENGNIVLLDWMKNNHNKQINNIKEKIELSFKFKPSNYLEVINYLLEQKGAMEEIKSKTFVDSIIHYASPDALIAIINKIENNKEVKGMFIAQMTHYLASSPDGKLRGFKKQQEKIELLADLKNIAPDYLKTKTYKNIFLKAALSNNIEIMQYLADNQLVDKEYIYEQLYSDKITLNAELLSYFANQNLSLIDKEYKIFRKKVLSTRNNSVHEAYRNYMSNYHVDKIDEILTIIKESTTNCHNDFIKFLSPHISDYEKILQMHKLSAELISKDNKKANKHKL